MDSKKKQQLYWLIIALAVLTMLPGLIESNRPEKIPYSQFMALVEQGNVKRVEIRKSEIRLHTTEGKLLIAQRLPETEDHGLVELLSSKSIEFSGKSIGTPWWQTFVLGWILPIGVIYLLYSLLSKRLAGKGGPLRFGKTEAMVFDRSKDEPTTFDDVAGVDEAEAELKEVVDFLKNAQKYQSLGARIPRGVLLLGPPGTGKTLLARAVAGEADVPFFAMSGSEFVEMFVGVGAARMRSLFKQAKERAPCIVFVDELDAIGKSRGGLGTMATNDEREQTLNQLLVEMDGFKADSGVVVMAATNRPEILDQALVRAGRFDRQILVDSPDLRGRAAILKIHARKVPLASDVDLEQFARRTPGMVGADLANVVNEATLAAARRGSSTVSPADFEEAIDRIQLGLKKQGLIMSEEERRRVAVHESGHALLALTLEHTDPVYKVTIVPRSIGALGATLQLPTEDRYLVIKEELQDRMCVMLGGRAAEELVCNSISTGAHDDLGRATETARQMVCRFGMSELGAQTFGRTVGLRFLKGVAASEEDRNFSEHTAEEIDRVVHDIVEIERERAKTLLSEHKDQLERITAALLVEETIDLDRLKSLVSEA